jgi:hypothetical protein
MKDVPHLIILATFIAVVVLIAYTLFRFIAKQAIKTALIIGCIIIALILAAAYFYFWNANQ